MVAAVHQLLPVICRGDAISGAAVRFRDLLRARGHRSELFAGLIDRHLGVDAIPAARLPAALGEGDAVVYHLSIGSTLAADFAQLPARRIVYYHNITPAELAED